MTESTRRPQKPRVDGWTKERREEFLDRLAATAHVSEAAEAAGLSATGAYALRRRDEVFAMEWRAALLCGYDRIEAAMIRKALGLSHEPVVDSGASGTPPGPGEIDERTAVFLLARHRNPPDGEAKRGGARAVGGVARAPRDLTAETLQRKLAAVEKRIRAREAKDRSCQNQS